jgi:hypothetical protein
MTTRTARMLAFGVVSLAMTVAHGTASAAPNVKLKVSENKNGPYVNAPGPNPFDVTTAGEDPKNLFMRASLAQNRSTKVRLYERLGSTPGAGDYHFLWFHGDTDISHDAQTSGYLFKLREGHPRKFRVRVLPEISDPGSACLFPLIEKNSSMNDLAEAFFTINDPNACV